MAKAKLIYICSKCRYESAKWMGQCPSCQSWNTLEEHEALTAASAASGQNVRASQGTGLKKLSSVSVSASDRLVTGLCELDRVMGGGITRDSVSIIAAKPGAGKSTLLMRVAYECAKKGEAVLYVSGEESEAQLRKRAERILPDIPELLWVQSTNSMNDVLGSAQNVSPALIIVDSIQTFSLVEFSSRPGTPTQTVECTNALIALAKNPEHPCAVFMAGQLTKEDELAGVRTLEHMVDTVLYMEADSDEELRILSASKNRFGSTGEMGFFTMEEDGLRPIDNPSEYFMTRRSSESRVSGTALTALKEGTRPIVAEVESLVSRSFTPYPTRISECMKREQLATLISILEQRGGLSLYDQNVVVKTCGGLKLSQASANLAAICSMVSSSLSAPISGGLVFIGDVGLTGELRRVPSMELMVRELDRMMFDTVIVPEGAVHENTLKSLKHIQVKQLRTLSQVLDFVFGSVRKRRKEESNAEGR